MFPTIGIENEEQRRLARLAGAIGGLANQLAQNTRQNDQNQTFQDHINQKSLFEEQLEMVKQEQLNEIMNDNDMMDLSVVEQQRSMLQERPGSNSNYSLLNASAAHRKSERPGTTQGSRQGGYGNRSKLKGQKRGNNLQKVYGNIVDLVGLEEQHITEFGQPRGRTSPALDHIRQRVGSGKPHRGGEVENIYLNQTAKYKSGPRH